MPGGLAALFIVGAFVLSGLKILREYERAVVFRLGRLVGARGPGIVYVIPGIEKALRIDLRTITMEIPSQDVITKDNVSLKVNAVLYFPRDRPEQGGGRGRELPLRHVPECPDHA